ncbi:MAG: signal peptidase I [Acidimicrobiales bacterium]
MGPDSTTTQDARTPPARPSRGWRRAAFEWVAIVLIAVLVAFLMRAFVVQTFFIPSASMSPTLKVGDRILVNKLAYKLHGVGRGDIVVFKHPPAEHCGTEVDDLVKRVIGLPGETISDTNGTIFIDAKPLAQPWLPKNDPGTFTPSFRAVHIPQNDYFVMGDNRVISCDSRFWGFVPRSLIVGKVEMRIWPPSRVGFF